MRLTALIAVVGAAIIAGALYLQNGRADGTCHAYEARTVVSPDGKMRAKIFKRDCGATTAESIQVSVLSRDVAEDDAPGNAFNIRASRWSAERQRDGGDERALDRTRSSRNPL